MILEPIDDKNFLSSGDSFGGSEVVRTSNYNVFFKDGSRKSWRRVLQEMRSGANVVYRSSPQVRVDWTRREQAVAYLRSFIRWGTYQSGTTVANYGVGELHMVEVIDGVLFHKGEWWIVGPSGTYDDWGRKVDFPNCLYSGQLCRVPNNWWGNKKDAENGSSIWVNVFFVSESHPTEWREYRLSTIGV